MAHALNKTEVCEAHEMERTQVKRTGKFLMFFDTEWWETVDVHRVGTDIHVKTDQTIRSVFVNDEEYIKAIKS